MRTVFALLPVCFALLGETRLSTGYDAARAFRVEAELTVKMETTKLEFGGGGSNGPVGGVSSKLSRIEAHVDRIIESESGRPKRVRRSFEKICGSAGSTFGPSTRDVEIDGPLEGVTIDIERSDKGKIDVSVVKGRMPSDDATLRGHVPELFLDALLPDQAVDADATWNLDKSAILRALRLDLERVLYPRAKGEERVEVDSVLLECADWKGKANLVRTDKEVAGMTCAEVEIEFQASGHLPGGATIFSDWCPPDCDAVACSEATDSVYHISLGGRLLFATKQRLPVSLEMEGTIMTEDRVDRTRNGQTVRVLNAVREGTASYKVAVFEEKTQDGK